MYCAASVLVVWLLSTQSAGAPGTVDTLVTGVAEVTSPAADSAKIEALRAQLRTIELYNDRLLSTVHWSLGVVGGIAVLLLGFGWYTNFKVYERDKAALVDELRTRLDTEMNRVETELEARMAERFQELTAKTESLVAALRNSLSSSIDLNTKRIAELSYEAIRAEARYWEAKEVPSNALTRYLSMLSYGQKEDDANKIGQALEGIRKQLEEGGQIYHLILPSVLSQLDSLPQGYEMQVEKIKSLLSERGTM